MRSSIGSILVLFLWACGGDADPTEADTEQPSGFCRAAAELQCASMYECLTDAERFELDLPATEDECRRVFESTCEDGIDSCVDDWHRYSGSVASDCLGEMAIAACNDAAEPFLDGPSCRGVCEIAAGAFVVRWRFEPTYYSCASVNATTVRVGTSNGSETVYDLFDCDDHVGSTPAFPLGDYQVRVELLGAAMVPLWASAPMTAHLDDVQLALPEVIVPVSGVARTSGGGRTPGRSAAAAP